MDGAALLDLTQVLPVPGPVWGVRPMRPDDDRAPPWRRPRLGSRAGHCRTVARRAAAQAQAFARLPAAQRQAALGALRRALRREGLEPAVMAQALGAAWIERHFTLDRTWKGTDHAASLEPDGLRRLVRDTRSVALAMHYKAQPLLAIEEPQRAKLKRPATIS